MVGSQSRVRRLFANRFEPDGNDFLFRANLRTPGVRVSASERDRFVANFNRGILIATWTTAAVTVLLILAAALVNSADSAKMPDYAIYLVLVLCLCPFLIAYYWLWNAPVRALGERQPETEGRSKAEAKQIAFQRTTWGQLGLAAAMAPLLLLKVSARHNLLVGWNRLWLLGAALLLVLIGVQAVRKWRVSNVRPPDGLDGLGS